MIKQFQKTVKHIFSQFGQHKDDLENIFPQFIRDYKRTTGRRERGWRKNISAAKQVRNSLRGMIYEGAVNHFTNNLENFEQVRLPIPYVDKNGKDREFEPDYWFHFNGYKIPVELKTYDKGRMAPATIKKGIKQSRKYGNLSVAGNPHKFSGIIVCNPEETILLHNHGREYREIDLRLSSISLVSTAPITTTGLVRKSRFITLFLGRLITMIWS